MTRSGREVLLQVVPFVLLLASVSAAVAQQDDSDDAELTGNFGREAREATPILGRDPSTPLSERERIHHVLSRFTLGPTADLIDEVEKAGLQEWFDAQLEGEAEESRELLGHLAGLDTLTMTAQEIVKKYNPPIPKELSLQNRLTPEQRRKPRSTASVSRRRRGTDRGPPGDHDDPSVTARGGWAAEWRAGGHAEDTRRGSSHREGPRRETAETHRGEEAVTEGRPLILGIESSCDETASAVVRGGTEILSNVLHSQIELHRRFSGVVPEIASRSHTTRILPIIDQALAEAEVRPEELTAVAVTNRPGMIGCLLVGMTAAKSLSWLYDLPLIGVDHIRAHIHAAFMTEPDLALPCLSLVASGGHTALYHVSAAGHAVRIGTTRDDAAGEAFDKGAAILGLTYPGGPAIEKAAATGDPTAVTLPRPLRHEGLDFSFSGVKTALLYHLRGSGLERPLPELDEAATADLAASYQEAIVDCLVTKLRRAAQERGSASLSIGGGVACNTRLRNAIAADPVLGQLQLVFPAMSLCTDNAAMVAGLGTLSLAQGHRDDLTLDAVATSRSRPEPVR